MGRGDLTLGGLLWSLGTLGTPSPGLEILGGLGTHPGSAGGPNLILLSPGGREGRMSGGGPRGSLLMSGGGPLLAPL